MPLKDFFGFKKRIQNAFAPAAPAHPAAPAPGAQYARPPDPARAVTIAEGVRNLRQEVEREHVELGGNFAARAAAVLAAMNQDDYDTADNLLQTLRNDVANEAQQRDALKQQYDTDKQTLEIGALARIPAAPPPALAGVHGAIAPARAQLPAAPQTLADYHDAVQKLATLDAAVQAYHTAESQLVDTARQGYTDARTQLEAGDLKKVPAQPPAPQLAQAHAAIMSAHAALPPDPQTLAEATQAQQAVAALQKQVTAYLALGPKALDAARRNHANERKTVERMLSNSPKKPPSGGEELFAQMHELAAQVPATVEKLEDIAAASAAVQAFQQAYKAFFAVEGKVLERLKAKYWKERDAMDAAGLAKINKWPPAGLEAEHAGIMAAGQGFIDPYWAFEWERQVAAQEKLKAADLVILQFPLWWFGLPAMLKGWVDRVMTMGFAYGAGRRYDQGGLKGRRAMLALTTGGPEASYTERGINGPMERILFPIQHGMLYFCGLEVLPPFVE